LPQSDADTWLAIAFADYEKIVALENAFHKRAADDKLTKSDREQLALALFGYRAGYELGARARPETPLASTHADLRNNDWYGVAAGKGVWLLHSLRRQMGGEAFDAMMDAFGRAHAGKPVSAEQFQAHVEKWLGNPRTDFFDAWLTKTGLPRFEIVEATSTQKGHEVAVEVRRDGGGPQTAIDVTVETETGEVTRTLRIDGTTARIVVETSDRPLRVMLDKYGQTARSNGGPFSVLTPFAELEQTLIVYGTADERATNREAAEALRQAILAHGSNITVAIRSDARATEEELKTHHLILIGRPGTNTLVERFRNALPISFGGGSFAVREEAYAHPDSAVIAAAENPLNKRYSLVVIAGLGAASTLRTAPLLASQNTVPAEVVIRPHEGATRSLVLPAKELVCEVKEAVR
jgi:hypothetical protein